MAKQIDPAKMSRRQQIVETFRMSKEVDRALPWWMLGAFLVFGAIGFGVFWILPGSGTFALVMAIVGGLLVGLLAMMIVFSRRAQRAAYARLEGQLGAAARALTMLRRGWQLEEMIGFTKQQDMVHRVVGPPGIVLVGEGNPSRLRPLLTSERKKHERVAAEFPVHEIVVGQGEGQVRLPDLVRHVRKLGRQVKPAEMTDILYRLKALDAQRPKIPPPAARCRPA
ncbi:DUF4191 domain-containing protein [Nocardioides sp. TF02-7]|uniref:DUF4191 domain-containing protein n=1 Tax=Nocardioides sp. TF02-7 TaxID=2917724 RepID=UPI001F057399|nr:DUF4191 domain-containing protein [Nocardioides sp. TF02-7]UMG92720.1 DUF4191 domain-containing protein [Nocardioides sp. TF02-7]